MRTCWDQARPRTPRARSTCRRPCGLTLTFRWPLGTGGGPIKPSVNAPTLKPRLSPKTKKPSQKKFDNEYSYGDEEPRGKSKPEEFKIQAETQASCAFHPRQHRRGGWW